MVKWLPAMQETWVRSLGREDPLKKEMATHSRILAWKIPWTEEPGRLQSTGHKSRIQLSTLSFLSLLMCDFICLKFSSFKNSVCRPPSLGSLPAVYSLSWATTACHLALGSHSCYTTSYSSACHAVSSLGTGTISFNSLLLVHDKSSWHKVGTCVRAHTLCYLMCMWWERRNELEIRKQATS